MEKSNLIFISGPMTGYENYNFDRFDEVEMLMRENGYDVVNPANIFRKYKREKVLADNNVFDEMIVEEQQKERECNAILLLNGWEKSVGCQREIKTAKELAFTFYHENDFPFLRKKRIGIFGGTFDPFTDAHYEIVRSALDLNVVDEVVVLPTVVNYYRKDKKQLFDYADRQRIIETWFNCGNRNGVIVNYLEYIDLPEGKDNSERCYFDMLKDMKKQYGEENEYYTILGKDSWESIGTWRHHEELLEECKFVVVDRSTSLNEIVPFKNEKNGKEYKPSNVIFLGGVLSTISASEIRENIRLECENSYIGYKWYVSQIEEHFKNTPKLKEISEKLDKIRGYLDDPYKDDACKYSLIEDVVNGRI